MDIVLTERPSCLPRSLQNLYFPSTGKLLNFSYTLWLSSFCLLLSALEYWPANAWLKSQPMTWEEFLCKHGGHFLCNLLLSKTLFSFLAMLAAPKLWLLSPQTNKITTRNLILWSPLFLSSTTTTIPPPQAQCHSLKVETRVEVKLVVLKCMPECFVNLCLALSTKPPPLNEFSLS